MTILKFYSAIIAGARVHVPTIDEARHDYNRAQAARSAAFFLHP